MRLLGVTRRAIRYRADTRRLLGVRTSDGQRVYPVWQFRDDGPTIPHLREVLDILAEGIDDPWTWATWLAAELPRRFGGKPAHRWLAEGHDPAPVLSGAHRTASRLAH